MSTSEETTSSTIDTENMSFTDFHSLDTIKYRGFTSKNMSEFEHIITNYTKMPKMQAMLVFYDTIRTHLVAENPHQVSISGHENELINQLYTYYRELGFTGSVRDMLLSMAKTLEVGSGLDYDIGIDKEKAVHVVGWQSMFSKHNLDSSAHDKFEDALQPNDCLNVDPTFYLSSFFGEQNYLIEDEGYTVSSSWTDRRGTLYLSLSYYFNGVTEPTKDEILSLEFKDFTIHYYLEYDPTTNKVVISIWKGTVKLIGATALSFPTEGYDRVLCIYNNDEFMVRTMTSTLQYDNHPFNSEKPIVLNVHVPLLARSSHTNHVTFKEIAHYPVVASATEQLFFLN